MDPLYRLPTGEWIELDQIHRISPLEGYDDGVVPHRVEILEREMLTVPFDSFSAAQAYADELAKLVNEARARAGASVAAQAYGDCS